jgi:hypothetical protein
MDDRKVTQLRPQRGVCIECNMQRPDHEPKTARCREQRKIQDAKNREVAYRWACQGFYGGNEWREPNP